MKVRAKFKYRECNLPRGKVGGTQCISHKVSVSADCAAQRDKHLGAPQTGQIHSNGARSNDLQANRGKCAGPKPRGGHSPQGTSALDTKKSTLVQPPDVPPSADRMCSVAFQQPYALFCLSFTTSGTTSNTIVSIQLFVFTSNRMITECMQPVQNKRSSESPMT